MAGKVLTMRGQPNSTLEQNEAPNAKRLQCWDRVNAILTLCEQSAAVLGEINKAMPRGAPRLDDPTYPVTVAQRVINTRLEVAMQRSKETQQMTDAGAQVLAE